MKRALPTYSKRQCAGWLAAMAMVREDGVIRRVLVRCGVGRLVSRCSKDGLAVDDEVDGYRKEEEEERCLCGLCTLQRPVTYNLDSDLQSDSGDG